MLAIVAAFAAVVFAVALQLGAFWLWLEFWHRRWVSRFNSKLNLSSYGGIDEAVRYADAGVPRSMRLGKT